MPGYVCPVFMIILHVKNPMLLNLVVLLVYKEFNSYV